MGSGKSEMKRLAIKAISDVSVASPGKKGAKIGGQIANAEVSDSLPLIALDISFRCATADIV